MSQNLVSLSYTDEQIVDVKASLTALEERLSGLIAIAGDKRRTLAKMGAKSEMFCRQTLNALAENAHVVPSSLGLAEAQSDLRALDQLRPVFERLRRLGEKATDTEFALGSDVMSASLQGYALLKVVGKGQGLEGLRKTLGGRFSKAPRAAAEVQVA